MVDEELVVVGGVLIPGVRFEVSVQVAYSSVFVLHSEMSALAPPPVGRKEASECLRWVRETLTWRISSFSLNHLCLAAPPMNISCRASGTEPLATRLLLGSGELIEESSGRFDEGVTAMAGGGIKGRVEAGLEVVGVGVLTIFGSVCRP